MRCMGQRSLKKQIISLFLVYWGKIRNTSKLLQHVTIYFNPHLIKFSLKQKRDKRERHADNQDCSTKVKSVTFMIHSVSTCFGIIAKLWLSSPAFPSIILHSSHYFVQASDCAELNLKWIAVNSINNRNVLECHLHFHLWLFNFYLYHFANIVMFFIRYQIIEEKSKDVLSEHSLMEWRNHSHQ
jgi:hypothetical protein